ENAAGQLVAVLGGGLMFSTPQRNCPKARLAQRHDLFERSTLLGLGDRAMLPGAEELRQLVAAEGVAEHAKGARRVAEAFGGLGRGRTFNIEGAMPRTGAGEESLARRRSGGIPLCLLVS